MSIAATHIKVNGDDDAMKGNETLSREVVAMLSSQDTKISLNNITEGGDDDDILSSSDDEGGFSISLEEGQSFQYSYSNTMKKGGGYDTLRLDPDTLASLSAAIGNNEEHGDHEDIIVEEGQADAESEDDEEDAIEASASIVEEPAPVITTAMTKISTKSPKKRKYAKTLKSLRVSVLCGSVFLCANKDGDVYLGEASVESVWQMDKLDEKGDRNLIMLRDSYDQILACDAKGQLKMKTKAHFDDDCYWKLLRGQIQYLFNTQHGMYISAEKNERGTLLALKRKLFAIGCSICLPYCAGPMKHKGGGMKGFRKWHSRIVASNGQALTVWKSSNTQEEVVSVPLTQITVIRVHVMNPTRFDVRLVGLSSSAEQAPTWMEMITPSERERDLWVAVLKGTSSSIKVEYDSDEHDKGLIGKFFR